MVVFYGVKRWRSWLFFGAAGGCGSRVRGWWGSRRPPRSRVSAGVRRLGLRFRRVLRKRRAQTTTAPTVRRLRAPARRACVAFAVRGARRIVAAEILCASVLHASLQAERRAFLRSFRDAWGFGLLFVTHVLLRAENNPA